MSLRLLRIALLVAVLVGLDALGTLGEPAAAAARDPRTAEPASEAMLTALTDASRSAGGLAGLEVDPRLVDVARWRSRDMAERGFFSHDIPGAGRVFDALTARGYCFELAGENIGWLDGPDEGAEERIQRMFLASAGHRRVMLGSAWDAIGIGAYRTTDGRHFWTVLFADRCDEDGPPG